MCFPPAKFDGAVYGICFGVAFTGRECVRLFITCRKDTCIQANALV